MTPLYATVREALERAADKQLHVRIFYGNSASGADDCDETWRVGKIIATASGFDLEVRNSKGDQLQKVRLRDVVRVRQCHRDLYRHRSYTAGQWSWRYNDALSAWTALRNDLIHATFKSEIDAAIYCAYITGDRQRPRSSCRQITFDKILKQSTRVDDTYYYKGGPNAND